MTNLDFLAGLPAVLGIGGYAVYQVSRSRAQASPILKTIVDIIKQKGVKLPALDKRLTAKHVYDLLEKNSELRRSLSSKDYALLESVMKRDERSHVFAMIGLIASLITSLAVYAYLQTLKPAIVSASIAAAVPPDSTQTVANTLDDMVVTWNHTGENQPFTLRISNTNGPDLKIEKQIWAADHTKRFSSSELQSLWPHPALNQKFPLRVEFSNDNGYKSFGPFDVSMALELMYFVDDKKLTVASMDGQNTLVTHSFESKCVAWPKKSKSTKEEPQSFTLNTSTGKATVAFPKNFELDPITLKCVYFGAYPSQLVRYTNLNIK